MGMFVPAKTPREIVVKIHREVARIVQLPDVKQRFAVDAAEAVGSTPEVFTAFLKAETARWTRVVKEAGIRLD
jgi:tripartite-type tricarboxylate transporter receptor subunit TctC